MSVISCAEKHSLSSAVFVSAFVCQNPIIDYVPGNRSLCFHSLDNFVDNYPMNLEVCLYMFKFILKTKTYGSKEGEFIYG